MKLLFILVTELLVTPLKILHLRCHPTFSPKSNLRVVLVLSPCYKWVNQSMERLSALAKITQQKKWQSWDMNVGSLVPSAGLLSAMQGLCLLSLF